MWQERDDDDDDDDNDAEDDDSGREGERKRRRRMTPACEVKDGVESLSGEREKGERESSLKSRVQACLGS